MNASQPARKHDNAEVEQYTLYDASFSVIALLNHQGSPIERYRYSPYGQRSVMNPTTFATTGSTSAYGNDRGFQGLLHDQETGLIENRIRMLDPLTGRFLQRDPLGYPDGFNAYAAYHVMHGGVDPSGEAWWIAARVVGGAIGRYVAAPVAAAATRRILAGQMARQAAAQTQRVAAAGAKLAAEQEAAALAATAATLLLVEAARRELATETACEDPTRTVNCRFYRESTESVQNRTVICPIRMSPSQCCLLVWPGPGWELTQAFD